MLETLLRVDQHRLSVYEPFPKQGEFHAAGAKYRQRCMLAGNQLGKTLSAGMETAYHLTGVYPDWWTGRRFTTPTKFWASNSNNETVRDNPQRILLGENCEWGTGTIPGHLLEKPTMARGFPDLVDTVMVRHVTGGFSKLQFKAYDQGVKAWRGETLHGVWFDEEPPADVYSEGVTRTNIPRGIVFITATPLLGMTEVVSFFYPQPDLPTRHLTMMEIWDVPDWLYSPEEKQETIDNYPEHERKARSRGIPILGSGAIFAEIDEDSIKVEAFKIPLHWPQLGGTDFGYDHPFAATLGAWDRDSDCWYITNAYKDRLSTPPIHAAAIRPWGEWLPWAWPHDGARHDPGSGKVLADQYRRNGVRMLNIHATFQEGGFSPEAAVLEAKTRMLSGRFKVFSHLDPWFDEFRFYHRKDGLIVAKKDDLLSATWKILMMKRYARTNDTPVQPTMVADFDPLASTPAAA